MTGFQTSEGTYWAVGSGQLRTAGNSLRWAAHCLQFSARGLWPAQGWGAGERLPLYESHKIREAAFCPSSAPFLQVSGTLAFFCVPLWTGSNKSVHTELEMANKA